MAAKFMGRTFVSGSLWSHPHEREAIHGPGAFGARKADHGCVADGLQFREILASFGECGGRLHGRHHVVGWPKVTARGFYLQQVNHEVEIPLQADCPIGLTASLVAAASAELLTADGA